MALRLGTSEHGGTFYTQGSAIAELYNRGRSEADRCVVHTSDASIHNANLLDRGSWSSASWPPIGSAALRCDPAFHPQDRAAHGGARECRADVLREASAFPDPDHR